MAELKRYTPKNGTISPDHKDGDVKLSDVNVYGTIDDRNGQGASSNGGHTNGMSAGHNDGDQEEDGEKKPKTEMVGTFAVFRFADKRDILLMIIGTIFACGNGASLPVLIIVFGSMIDFMVDIGIMQNYLTTIPEFLQNRSIDYGYFVADTRRLDDALCADIASFYNGNKTCTVTLDDRVMEKMTEFAIYYTIIGGAVWLSGYIQVAFWMTSAERISNRIRQTCLQNILRQDIGWFDTHEAAELNTKLSDDILKIQDGIGDKVGSMFQWTAGFITGFAIGFYYGWKMTLVILAVSPAIAIAAGLMAKLASSMTSKELQAYGKAGGVAEEVFASIRTVVAFGGQEKEACRYYSNLDDARKFGIRKGFTNGAAMGVIWLIIFCCYALGFWYGGKLHREDPEDFDVSNLMIVFFCVLIGAFSLGNASPSVQALSAARGAAFGIYQLIDLKSPIDSASTEGLKPSKVTGLIEFKNVHFTYPARPDVKILHNFSIEARPGQTVALVGSSGCGKSTTVQLLLRFYDPENGKVLLDGNDIRDLNVKWLRQSIGLVSQEPILFATTIAENIRYGRDDVTMDEIVAATKNANAYNFIMKLPDKFETLVGERGAQLSGGQKQRIAIARALVRDPKILLLDEATSALDTESESIVQDALDKARMGRTTLVIAHRLSTIKTADIIIGLNQGQVMERGTHDELMAHQGIYHQLVMNQMQSTEEDKEMTNMLEMQDKKKLERLLSSKSLQRKNSTLVEQEEEADEELPNAPFSRLIKMNAPEWYLILFGCLGSMVNGAVMPAFAVIFSRIIYVFAEDKDTQETEMRNYALMFVGIGLISFITMFLQSYMFACSGEALTVRIRDLAFRSMLRQEISWYDDAKNGVGALTTRLSTDASQVQGVTGHRLGSLLNSMSNITTALVIAFIYGWQMTLVILGFLPLIALGGFMQIKLLAGQAGKNKEALEGAGKVTVESIGNIRTVASLSQEEKFYQRYNENLHTPYKAALKNAHVVGFVYAFSQAVIFFAYAASFIFGAYMIEENDMDFDDVFLVFGSVIFGAMGLGNASAFAPDLGKAQTSAKRILYILDSKPTIDYTNTGGKQLDSHYTATVTFKDVTFHYATRASVPVLQGLNVSVTPGQTLALVGSSGCGKSTAIQLMERFYDAITGAVCLDNFDVKTLNIEWYRSQLGLVSQEPILFDSSIAENIAYGDNSRVVGMEEIIEAARGANIHTFISSLPDGYKTNVGAKGTQLSGGQKQRIAIARALVRNPKILLLDEATSALDTESEKIVQEALDKARAGRTCVVIAHRLSTVQNADKICVVSHGKVTEEGTHSELMAKEGFYYKLVKKSQRQP